MIHLPAILRKLLFSAIGVLLFLVILNWSVPYLIETEMVRDQIHQRFDEQTGGKIKFEHLDLDLLPWPRIEIHKARLSIPPNIQATAETIQIYPNLRALFFSQVSIAAIQLVSGNLMVHLTPALSEPNSANDVLETWPTLQNLQTGLIRIPKLRIGLNNSRLQLFKGEQLLVELNEMDADVNRTLETLKFEVDCVSKDWKRIRIAGHLNEESMTSQGDITLDGLKLNNLDFFLADDSPIHIEDGLVNADMHFSIDNLTTASVSGTGSLPSITLGTDQQQFELRNDRFSVQAKVDNKSITIAVDDIIFKEPDLRISSARLSIHPKSPQVELEITGESIDIGSTRTIALGLSGESPVAATIFDVLRRGTIPKLHLRSRANSIHELGQPPNLLFQGTLTSADLHIPGIELDLSDSNGNIRIADGQLHGTDLNARLGNSVASQGELKLGLGTLPLPIDLSFDSTASLPDLLPILAQVPAIRKFEKQLSMLEELKGTASGNVRLKGTTAALKADVEASQLQLTAKHESLPFPVKIESGQLALDDKEIRIKRLNGRFGRSIFDRLSGNLTLEPDFPIHLSVGASKLELAELKPWLTSFESLKKLARYRVGEQSHIALTEATVDGPIGQPTRWQFNVSGNLDSIEIATLPDFEKPINIDSGSFKLDARTLQYSDIQFRVLDANGTASGTQKEYPSAINHKGRISLTAHLGKDASGHLSHLFNLKPKFRLPPLDLDATEISWKTADKIRLSGTAAIENGPKVDADISYDSEKLDLHRLQLTDRFSNALIALQLSKSLIKLSFKGNLDKTTLQPFVIGNDLLLGSVSGDFEAQLNLLEPARSTTRGKLNGERINLVGLLDIPLLIHNFSLETDENKVYLQSAEFALADNQMTATGSLASSAKTLQIDLDFSTPFFNWESIVNHRGTPQTAENTPRTVHSNFPDLRGTIRFQAERFKFHQFTWTPLNADLNFTEQKTVANLSNAKLCGISTPTRIELSAERVIRIEMEPSANHQPLQPALECLFGKQFKIDGHFNLSGQIKAIGSELGSPKPFKGQILFDAQNGRIYKDLVFFKILDYLNATEILIGNHAELKKSGMIYNAAHTKVDLDDGVLHFSDLSMDSPTMNLAGIGEIDLDKQSLNAKFLIAPLKAVNRILDYVPIVGGILEDVVSIPIELNGPLKDLQVTPLSPAAIGAQLMNIFNKTVNTPVRLIQPILPEDIE